MKSEKGLFNCRYGEGRAFLSNKTNKLTVSSTELNYKDEKVGK
jgi:hypothetical protein